MFHRAWAGPGGQARQPGQGTSGTICSQSAVIPHQGRGYGFAADRLALQQSGVLMTANGTGMLVGSIASGAVTRLARGRLGVMVMTLDAIAGLAFAELSAVRSMLAGCALLVLVGMFAGTVQIAIITWLQRRVPQAMMGRTMSFVMFTFMGFAPLAAAAAGALLKVISLSALFVGAGLSLTILAMFCLTRRSLRAIQLQTATA